MAAASENIVTDALNLKIVKVFPVNKIDDIFVDLGFDQVDIEKRRVVAQLSSSLDRLIIDLLSSWKDKHGRGLDQAETLKGVMEKHGVERAVKAIQEAIDKVIPPPPQADVLANATSTSTCEQPSPMKS